MSTILIGYTGDISKSIFEKLKNESMDLVIFSREIPSSNEKNIQFIQHNITESPITIEQLNELKIDPSKLDNLIFTSAYPIGQEKFKNLTYDQIKKSINGNVTNCLITIQNFIKYRTSKSSGTIVTFGSQATLLGGNLISTYSAGKAAIETFTKAVAKEFADENIRITCISPFSVNSGPFMKSLQNAPDRDRREKLAAKPVQIARLVLNLINEEGFAYSGAIIPITSAR